MTKYKKLLIGSTIFLVVSTLVFLFKDIFIRSLFAPLFHFNMEVVYRLVSGTFVDYLTNQLTVIAIIIAISVILFSLFYFISTFMLYKKSKMVERRSLKWMRYIYIIMFMIPFVFIIFMSVTTIIAVTTIQTEVQLMQQTQPLELILQELMKQVQVVSLDKLENIFVIAEQLFEYVKENSHLIRALERGFNQYQLMTSTNILYNFTYTLLLVSLWLLHGYSWVRVYLETKNGQTARF